MDTQPRRNRDVEEKIAEISQLKTAFPAYREILDFFEPVLRERLHYKSQLMRAIHRPVVSDAGIRDKLRNGIPLIERSGMQFDGKIMAAHLKALLKIIQSRTPQAAELAADILKDKNFNVMATGGENRHAGGSSPANGSGDILDFLVKETLSPVLEIYAEAFNPLLSIDSWENGYCPMCGEPPAMATIAGDNGKRSLICGACATRWPFPRTACPFCGNNDQQRLSYLFVENDDKYRIEVCDACRQYLKTVDLRNMGRPVDFEVENIITLHLDMIAMENGYAHPLHPGDPEYRSGERLN
ncbi:MAG: formate dehydrogenase accessory protein FdhE [Desulfosalsimonadaceae bacterium]